MTPSTMPDHTVTAGPPAGQPVTESVGAQPAPAVPGLDERLLGAAIESMDLLCVYIGDKLGWYAALDGQTAGLTSAELARVTTTAERYAREWLEQQAVTGILAVDDLAADAAARRYTLSDTDAPVLLDPASCSYSAPLATFAVQLAATMPALLAAYRTGGGVPMAAFGADAVTAQGGFNRPAFTNTMPYWFTQLPELAEILRRPGARAADVACGVGWSSICLAQNFSALQVDGFDNDELSIALARRNAAGAGVADRVRFHLADAATIPGAGYDLVTVFEAIHDLARPVPALIRARALLKPGGTVLVADERVADTFTAPGDAIERLFYGASLLFCLPTGMAEPGSAATGAVFRASALSAYATDAGFSAIDIAPIESPTWRFYLLR